MTKVTHLTLDERGALSRKRIHLREISGDADAPLETVGQDLRAARLRRGDDLATVSRTLKIRRDHLEALEEDRFEALPGRAYAVGFVRSYADYLGLDPLQYVERFKGEIAGRTEVQATVGPPPDADMVRLPQGWLVIGVVALVAIVYGAYHLAKSADTLLRQPVAPVPSQIAPPPTPTVMAQSAAPKVAAAPLPTSGGPATVPNAAAPPAVAQTMAPSTRPSPQAPPVPISAPKAPAAQTNVASTTPQTANPPQTEAPGGHVYGASNRNPRVVLHAEAPARVLIQGSDGTVFLNRMLEPGDSYDVPNKVGLTVTTPNGGALSVELDGQPMGHVGAASKMTEAFSLDPQAIVDRYNRGNPG